MILECIRMVADALGHSERGVNAELGGIARDYEDAMPPSIVRILDSTRDDEAVADLTEDVFIPDWPVLVVSSDTPALFDGEVRTWNRDSDSVQVSIRYITDSADAAINSAHTLYTLRAILSSLREWLRNENAAYQTRNGVNIMYCSGLTWGEVREVTAHGIITGLVVADFAVRDTTP